ncbi:MAG TPA: acyl-homoserine-lactone synthase [Actinocrinis sp.]|jgi:N-acyl-L-homoserine lactone synthetase
MTSVLLTKMFRLRYEVFHRQLGWDVDGTDGLERDGFDGLAPVYALAVSRMDDSVVGCLRMLPTLGPHMLGDVAAFQPALQGRPCPRSPRIWEISRLAVTPRCAAESAAASPTAMAGFGPVPRALLAATGTYALRHGIETFSVLSAVAVERKANASGIPSTRIGDRPTRIGSVLCSTYCVPASALADLAGSATGAQRAAPGGFHAGSRPEMPRSRS